MTMKKDLLCLLLLLLLQPMPPAHAESFESWLSGFKRHAAGRGISPSVLQRAFDEVSPDPRVIELDKKQPERKKIGFENYVSKVISQNRIDRGRTNLRDNFSLLQKTEMAFGVPAEIVVALWGIETSYGSNTGNFDLIRSLATLAWDGRRRDFFENELLMALSILQGGHIARADFKGSWAGAMGQNQFMPSSWRQYAVDANGDGHKDIWNSRADVFASSANYLRKNGWNMAYPWGWLVEMPSGAALQFANSEQKRPLIEWIKMGVHFSGGPIPSSHTRTPARLVIPDGGEGRAYLVTSNFDTIMSWNKSTYFALTVGLLSDYISKSKPNANSENGVHLNP